MITALYNQIRKKERLGEQYEWLARMAAQLGINDLELSIETPLPYTFVGRHIRPFLARENPADNTSYRLMHTPAIPEVSLFSCFKWPVIEITKLDMQKIAIKYGFYHVMKETWFCHRPNRKQQPCGVCMPCHIAILEGMGHRVPFTSRVSNYYEFKIKRPLRKAFKTVAMANVVH
ncbi:7-cyano-7-deazaguanine synthase [Pontibacter vulgaris]|uniref:7-cyano-7-deazaguanine synthase n=1 Tax=Pontibacter vulgaris TaxID=2905679 RepID=UPI001FA70E54|nr:7-cyano-7-deazaguanine synthase [Pontibacter vulgaris]